MNDDEEGANVGGHREVIHAIKERQRTFRPRDVYPNTQTYGNMHEHTELMNMSE
jgi:hypothetical protein